MNLSNTEPESFKRYRKETACVGLEVGTFEFDLSMKEAKHDYP